MSTSSSLSSAKRRRAGNEVLNTPVNNISSSPMVDNGSRIMSVQDVLYMLNSKIELLSSKVGVDNTNNSSSSSMDNSLLTQITDSIDNMNNTLEQFSEMLSEYDSRIKNVENVNTSTALEEKNRQLEEKIKALENRINEKILAKTTEKTDILAKKRGNTTKEKLAEMVPNKSAVTVDDKFAEKAQKKSNLKKFEEDSASKGGDNIQISFTGLKDEIESNKEK